MRHSKEDILCILNQLENKKAEELETETLDFKAKKTVKYGIKGE